MLNIYFRILTRDETHVIFRKHNVITLLQQRYFWVYPRYNAQLLTL